MNSSRCVQGEKINNRVGGGAESERHKRPAEERMKRRGSRVRNKDSLTISLTVGVTHWIT